MVTCKIYTSITLLNKKKKLFWDKLVFQDSFSTSDKSSNYQNEEKVRVWGSIWERGLSHNTYIQPQVNLML